MHAFICWKSELKCSRFEWFFTCRCCQNMVHMQRRGESCGGYNHNLDTLFRRKRNAQPARCKLTSCVHTQLAQQLILQGTGYLLTKGWLMGQKKEVLEIFIEEVWNRYADMSAYRQILFSYPTVKSAQRQGMKNGDKIRFRQKGNMAPGFLPGDIGEISTLHSALKIIFQFNFAAVILKTKQHDVFQRKNADLLMSKKLSLHEALCGFEFQFVVPICFIASLRKFSHSHPHARFKHLDGREILIKSKPGQIVADNSLKMLSGEGFPHRVCMMNELREVESHKLIAWPQGDKYEKGSLFVNFLVDLPGDGELTETQQREIRQILTGRPTQTLCPRTEETWVLLEGVWEDWNVDMHCKRDLFVHIPSTQGNKNVICRRQETVRQNKIRVQRWWGLWRKWFRRWGWWSR